MTTQEIIDDMRMHIKMAMPAAANRLEQLWKERDEARDQKGQVLALNDKLVCQRDEAQSSANQWKVDAETFAEQRNEARAEVERLKEALSKAIVEIGRLQNLTPAIRPEPSRLEIAAMIYAGIEHIDDNDALKAADKLIATARGAK